MAHVDAEKFHEVMTCFYIAAQSAGNAGAGSVFEKCMYAISSALPGASSGGMHMPTVQLLQEQLPSCPAPPSPTSPSLSPSASPFSSSARAGRDAATQQRPFSLHASTPTYAALERPQKDALGSLAVSEMARSSDAAKSAEKGSHEAPVISPSKFPQFKGFPVKGVCQALQRQFPHARIEILRDGQKLVGVCNDRIVVVANRWGDVAASPRVG
jgi:hypothetical protein